MKHYLLYLCAASLFFSCSKSDQPLPDDGADGKMHFAADIPAKEDDWSRATRGPIIDNNTITDFGAFCFHTGLDKWADVSVSATPNKMSNVEVTRTPATNDWIYTPPVAWNGGDMSYFTFFGYAPYATVDNGITAPASGAAGTPSLGFVVGDEVLTQVDLLVAKPVYNTAPVAKVKMQFAHALSCIGFKAYSLVPDVKVSKIQITGVKYKGYLALDGLWSSEAATNDFAITYNPAVEVTATTIETAVNLSAAPNGFFLLPQDLRSNATAKIIFTFSIRDVEIIKEYVIKEEWEQSKRITYTVDLTTNIKESLDVTDVTITDWGVGTKLEGEGEGEAIEVELIYDDHGAMSSGGIVLLNGELPIAKHPASALQAWNTKSDGSGDYYGEGDRITLKDKTTLYAVDNTVTIGGMRWLRGNLLGTAGSDAGYYTEGNPSKSGMFFKWGDTWVYQRESSDTDGMAGDKRHYASTEPKISSSQGGYDYTGLTGGRVSGDPCQKLGENFLTPTIAQYMTLERMGNKTDTYRDVAGCFFGVNAAACTNNTIAPGCIFIPFAGRRSYDDGTLSDENTGGSYWASTASSRDESRAKFFRIFSSNITVIEAVRGDGRSVRCVSTDVKVGGVNWTTSNLEGSPGTATGHKMAKDPQSHGLFFKWGDMWVYQREASTTDGMMAPAGSNDYTWRAATTPGQAVSDKYDYESGLAGGPAPGDPCRMLGKAYRTPTTAEARSLEPLVVAADATYRGVQGRFYGVKANECRNDKIAEDCVFLPHSDGRDVYNGKLDMWVVGGYWTSSVTNFPGKSSSLSQSRTGVGAGGPVGRGFGMSVRCVRDATIK